MRQMISWLFIGIVTWTLSTSVFAQDADPCEKVTCSNHGDCIVKGDEPVCACHEGYIPDATTGLSCQPSPQSDAQDTNETATAATVAPTAPDTSPTAGDGWALGAAISGFASASVLLGLGVGAVATTQEGYDNVVPIGIGAAALLVMTVLGPVVHAGGKSARRAAGVNGVLGARITAWVLYGLTLANGLAEIGLAAADISIEKWQVSILVGTGTLSLILFSIDALIASKQARRKMEQSAKTPNRLLVSPIVAPVAENGRASGVLLGLGGAF